MDEWEVFIAGSRRMHTKQIGIGVSHNLTIHMSAAAARALGNPEQVHLLYNRALRAIGIQPSETGSYRVSMNGNTRSKLSGSGFLCHYDLQDWTGFHLGRIEDGMLIVPIETEAE